MENCLTQKLKGICANTNLVKIGELIIHHSQVPNKIGSLRISKVDSGEKITISVPSGFTFSVDGGSDVNSYDIPANSIREYLFTFNSGNYDIHISNKYDLSIFGFEGNADVFKEATLKMSDIKYLQNITTFNCSNLGPGLTGSVNDVPDTVTLQVIQIGFNSIKGTLYEFGSRLKGDIGAIQTKGTLITGDVIDFVNAQIDKAGKTSVSVNNAIRWIGIAAQFKFNDFTMIGDYGRLAYENRNKIVVGTDQLNFADCNTLYEKGYSAEEIKEWTDAGKTVTDVVSGTVYPPTNG